MANAADTRTEPVAPTDPDVLYEVVDGKIVELPSKGIYSAGIASRLLFTLANFAIGNQLGFVVSQALFILDAERLLKRRPNVAFVSRERWPENREWPEEGDWDVVPDLAIEVISPNDMDRDVQRKLREYFEAGVRQVWHVRPDSANITVYRSLTDVTIFGRDVELEGGDLLPGFRLPVEPLFRRTAT